MNNVDMSKIEDINKIKNECEGNFQENSQHCPGTPENFSDSLSDDINAELNNIYKEEFSQGDSAFYTETEETSIIKSSGSDTGESISLVTVPSEIPLNENLPVVENNFPSEQSETISSVITSKLDEDGTIEDSHLEEVKPPGSPNTPLQDFELTNGISKLTKKSSFSQGLNKKETMAKMKDIIHALETNDVDMLKQAALSKGGLLNDNIRRKVWPKLVGVDEAVISPRPCQEEIEQHPYYQQVVLDVNRSLKRFPPSIQEAQRLTMLDQLVVLIMRVLCKHRQFHYYQGYHDICVTFLLVLGEETAFHVVEKLSLMHLRIFMERSMEPTIHLLEYIYHLIGKRHPAYEKFLMKSEVGVAYCLSWLITWFSHVLNDYSTVVRFFDFFLVSHHWMPMYMTASIVLFREPEVIKQDCDMASVHSLLCVIPDDLPFEELLTESIELFECYKPKSLTKERPYVKIDNRRRVRRWTLWSKYKYIPTTLVIAAAVLVSAYLYQAYKY